MHKVLITGFEGFIDSHLTIYLIKAGYKSISKSRKNKSI